MAHLPPSHEWKSISPCVVLAEKFGAMLPNRNRGCSSIAVASPRPKKGEIGGRAARREQLRGFQDRGAERVRRDAIVGERDSQYPGRSNVRWKLKLYKMCA